MWEFKDAKLINQFRCSFSATVCTACWLLSNQAQMETPNSNQIRRKDG